MSEVPSELVWEILLRLPAESLLRFKTVCKEWLRTIEDRSFIKAHTNNQIWSHTLLVKSGSGPPLYSYSFCLDSFNFINASKMIDVTRFKNLILPCVPLFFVASCNGLILTSYMGDDEIDSWVILNPLTRECHYLPKPNVNVALYLVGYGFGYHSDSDDYKVVRIYEDYRTLIYSLKSDSWRTVEKGSPCCGIQRNATFLNDSLYRLSWHNEVIIALDLGTQMYCQLPLPPVIHGFGLDAMDGCLICSLKDKEKETFDGWVMKDDGVEKLWIKLFSLQYPIFLAPLKFRFVAYLKRKEQVVLRHREGFWWFDIGNNSIKKCYVCHLDIISCLICPGSLVQLSDYRGSHIGVRDVTIERTLPVPEKMKMICEVDGLYFSLF